MTHCTAQEKINHSLFVTQFQLQLNFNDDLIWWFYITCSTFLLIRICNIIHAWCNSIHPLMTRHLGAPQCHDAQLFEPLPYVCLQPEVEVHPPLTLHFLWATWHWLNFTSSTAVVVSALKIWKRKTPKNAMKKLEIWKNWERCGDMVASGCTQITFFRQNSQEKVLSCLFLGLKSWDSGLLPSLFENATGHCLIPAFPNVSDVCHQFFNAFHSIIGPSYQWKVGAFYSGISKPFWHCQLVNAFHSIIGPSHQWKVMAFYSGISKPFWRLSVCQCIPFHHWSIIPMKKIGTVFIPFKGSQPKSSHIVSKSSMRWLCNTSRPSFPQGVCSWHRCTSGRCTCKAEPPFPLTTIAKIK